VRRTGSENVAQEFGVELLEASGGQSTIERVATRGMHTREDDHDPQPVGV